MIIIVKSILSNWREKTIKIDNVYKFLLGIVLIFCGFLIKMRITQ
ncbi:MAG: hypothetical protein E7E58_01560 [Paeniclostridium sordellii]|nr:MULTISPECIES: hypothetical protein [Paeniclostridium]MDU2146654.1 hypothetical protein [Paeniclostridium sordellii]